MPDMRVLKTKARQSDRRQTPSFSWGKALCSCYIIPDALALALTQCSQESRPVFASAQARLARLQEEINDYAGKLDWREISPTGDDFNHLLDLLSSENSLPPFNADPAFRAQMDALKETTEILNAIFDEPLIGDGMGDSDGSR